MNSASSLGRVQASNRALCPRPLRRQNQILTLYLALYLPLLETVMVIAGVDGHVVIGSD